MTVWKRNWRIKIIITVRVLFQRPDICGWKLRRWRELEKKD